MEEKPDSSNVGQPPLEAGRVQVLLAEAIEYLGGGLRLRADVGKLLLKAHIKELCGFAAEGFDAITSILDNPKCPEGLSNWAVCQFKLAETGGEVKREVGQLSNAERLIEKYKLPLLDILTYSDDRFNDKDFGLILKTYPSISGEAQELFMALRGLKDQTTAKIQSGMSLSKKPFSDEVYRQVKSILHNTVDTTSPGKKQMLLTLSNITRSLKLFYSADDEATETREFQQILAGVKKLPDSPDCKALIQFISEELIKSRKNAVLQTCSDLERHEFNKGSLNKQFIRPFISEIRRILDKQTLTSKQWQIINKLTLDVKSFLSASDGVSQKQNLEDIITSINSLDIPTNLKELVIPLQNVIIRSQHAFTALLPTLLEVNNEFPMMYGRMKPGPTASEYQALHDLAGALISINRANKLLETENQFDKKIVPQVVSQILQDIKSKSFQNLKPFIGLVETVLSQLKIEKPDVSQQVEYKEVKEQPSEQDLKQKRQDQVFLRQVNRKTYELLGQVTNNTKEKLETLDTHVELFVNSSTEGSRIEALIGMYNTCFEILENKEDKKFYKDLVDTVLNKIDKEFTEQMRHSVTQVGGLKSKVQSIKDYPEKSKKALGDFIGEYNKLIGSLGPTIKLTLTETRKIKKLADSLLKLGSALTEAEASQTRQEVQTDNKKLFTPSKQPSSFSFYKKPDPLQRIQKLIDIVKTASSEEPEPAPQRR